MKKKIILYCLFLSFSISYSSTVQASIITLGELSRDTETNIVKQGVDKEWLMWTETNAFTDHELKTLFDTGSLNGWYLARYGDVLDLYSSAGLSIYDTTGGANLTFGNVVYSGDDVIPGSFDTPSNVHFNHEFFNLFGDTYYEMSAGAVSDHSYSLAFFYGENTELGNTSIHNYYGTHHEQIYFESNYSFKSIDELISLSWVNTGSPYSVALYRPSPIPEPSTIFLMGLGLLGIAGIGREN